MPGQAIATPADLPKIVGYKQLRELYGWPKRTIQDWIKARKFPKPLDLPGRENHWLLDDIVGWMRGDLTKVAVTNPDDLEPDQLDDRARDFAARALSKRIGRPVNPSSVGLHLTRVLAEEDLDALEREEFGVRAEQLAALSLDEAVTLAAALLPQLRPVLGTPSSGGGANDAIGRVVVSDLFDFLIQVDLRARLSLSPDAPPHFGSLPGRIAAYGLGRAIILSAWLFPVLRPVFVANTNGADAQLFTDDTKLRELAWSALDDERWQAAEQGLLARQSAQSE